MIPGIDVSIYQGAVDWNKVAASGVKFAFLRSSYGKDSVDPTFAHNRTAAKAAGVKVGAYHFAYPSLNTAEQEAAHFMAVAKPVAGELLPVLDFEQTMNVAWAAQFVSILHKELGVWPILYASSSWLSTLGKNATLRNCPVWQADYGPNDGARHTPATIYKKPVVHQYTSVGQVPGVSGHVDKDVCLVPLSQIAYVKPKVLIGFTVSYVTKAGKRVEKNINHPVFWSNTHKKAYRRGRVVMSRRFA